MNNFLRICSVFLVLGVFGVTTSLADTELKPALASVLIKKVASFEKRISKKQKCSIYVLNSPEVEKSLSKSIGKKVGECAIDKVEGGEVIPPYVPDLLVVGEKADVVAAVNYARALSIVTIGLTSNMVSAGVPVGVVHGSDGRAHILLNLKASTEFKLSWRPSIMKYAETLRTFDK